MPIELSNHPEILLRVAHWKAESDKFMADDLAVALRPDIDYCVF